MFPFFLLLFIDFLVVINSLEQKDHRFHTKLASPHNESSPAESDEKDSVFDNLIDNTLEGIRKNPLFDPLILHRNYSFDIYKIQIVPFDICLSNCFLGINDGQIYGLQSIKRIENVDLDYQDPDLIADFSVSVENVDLSMKISFTIGEWQWFNFPIDARIESLWLKLIVAIGSKNRFRILQVIVTKLERISLNFERKHIQHILNGLINFFFKNFDNFFKKILSQILFEIISNEIKYIQKDYLST
ncbi:hypothetical protein NH340_JMT06872 [Sarcoptes scabiei]|nr:hypothetical protein NH340_JMT06872 [Sarcoptes scabiei]